MKKLLYVFIAIALVSCGSGGTKTDYKKTIADYVQTDKKGTKYDLKFKVLELEEQGVITIGDSIAYLTDEFRKDKEFIIKRVELAKEMTQELLSKSKRENDIDKYNAHIVVMDNRIDSLKNLTPDNLNGYDKRNAGDVLAKIVRCKYSITMPHGISAEETFDFYLSADGSKCYGKKRAR